MVITKERLKVEIEDLPEQYSGMIYRILRALIQMPKLQLANTKITPEKSHPVLGAFIGAGKTVGDLLEPIEDEWECD